MKSSRSSFSLLLSFFPFFSSLFRFMQIPFFGASFLPSFSSMRDIRLSDFWVRFLSPDKNCFFQTQEIRKKLRRFIGGSGCLLVVERTLRDRELVGSNLTDYWVFSICRFQSNSSLKADPSQRSSFIEYPSKKWTAKGTKCFEMHSIVKNQFSFISFFTSVLHSLR